MITEVLVIVGLFGIYTFVVILKWAQKRRKIYTIFKKLGIPGPEPNFLDGNMDELRSQPHAPNIVMTKWCEKYGPFLGYFYGDFPFVMIKDLEILKQVLVKDFLHFSDRPDLYMEAKPFSDGILTQKGQRWKTVRSILTPTFSSSKIKLMTHLISKRIDVAISNIENYSRDSTMFNIQKNLQALTLDVISECAFAMDANCQSDMNNPLVVMAQTIINLAHNKAIEFAIKFSFLAPIFRFLARFSSQGKGSGVLVEYVKKQIKLRRNNPNFRRVDMLQLMLQASDEEESNKNGEVQLSDDELVGNAFVFLLAGYETSSTALTFTFWLLVTHPEIQERLYQEILEHCPNKGDVISYDTVNNMKYLDQVFNESLRIYPPVTGFVSRICVQECQVGDYVIPKGVGVFVPVWLIHRDPELWPNPDEFDPERFSPENKSRIQSLSFLPFGHGPRNCIGMRFAQLESKLVIARLLQRFQFVPCEKTDKPPLPLVCPTIIMNPANGVYLRAISRSDNAKLDQ